MSRSARPCPRLAATSSCSRVLRGCPGHRDTRASGLGHRAAATTQHSAEPPTPRVYPESVSTSLVFVHGRYADSGDWVGAINTGLVAAGRQTLPDEVDTVQLDYSDVLHDVLAAMPARDIELTEPWLDYARHQRMVRQSMHLHQPAHQPVTSSPRVGHPVPHEPDAGDPALPGAARGALRGSRALHGTTSQGDLIIVGHSLGSVVTFDLLHYLPRTLA